RQLPPAACDICVARLRRSRWVDELRVGYCGWMASSWRLYWPHSQGCDAEGSAGRAVKQVRTGHQRTDRTDVWPRSSGPTARHCRRGDRVMRRREFITLLGGADLRRGELRNAVMLNHLNFQVI